MTLVAVIATTLLALTACGTKAETANEVNNFRIKRGTNLSHWLSQNNEDRGGQSVALRTPHGAAFMCPQALRNQKT